MKRIAVALSLVALSAYGIGCEKPAAAPAVKVETTTDGAKVEHTDEAGHTTTTEVKTDEKPAAETPAVEAPATTEEKPADKPADEKPADEKPAADKPAEEKPAN